MGRLILWSDMNFGATITSLFIVGKGSNGRFDEPVISMVNGGTGQTIGDYKEF
jgi:hypothetical protein